MAKANRRKFKFQEPTMTIETFLNKLRSNSAELMFEDAMACIEANYDFSETAFQNGNTKNEAGQNNGSCKVFAFGKLNDLNPSETLSCFGQYYRIDVLENPDGEDHQNIRNFMEHGWDGIHFEGEALQTK